MHVGNHNGLDAAARVLLQQAGDRVTGRAWQETADSAEVVDGVGWGYGADFVISLLPVVAVLGLCIGSPVLSRSHAPPRYSKILALAAAVMWFFRLSYFKSDSTFTNAVVMYGLLNSLKPLSIVFGGFTLIQALQDTQVCKFWFKML